MFFGSIPALVTPFSGGRVAEDTFAEFVEWQIAEGINALVPCGTTGEERDPEPRRAPRSDRAHRGNCEGPGAGDRRLRQLFDSGRDRAGPRLPPTSGPTPLGRRALLQQAEPGGARQRISWRSPRPRRCRSSSTTFRRAPWPTFRSRRWPGSRSIRGSSRSRTRPATWPRVSAQRLACGEEFVQLSRQRRHGAWASTRWAESVAFRSPPTSRRSFARISRRRCARDAGTKR